MNIQFIGGEGGGKTTAIDRLRAENVFPDALFVRQPGGTEISEAIRDQVLFNKGFAHRPSPRTQFHLFMAARCQLWDEVLRPALRDGRLCISDRGEDGTYVYQCYAQLSIDNPQRYVDCLNEMRIPLPDLSLLFHLDPEVGLQRKQGDVHGNFFDQEKLAFHHRISEGYRRWTRYLEEHGHHVDVIDASKSPDDVYTEVKRLIAAHL